MPAAVCQTIGPSGYNAALCQCLYSSSGCAHAHIHTYAHAMEHAPQALLKVTIPRTLGHQPQPSSTMFAVGECAGGDAAGIVTDEWRPGPRCFIQEPMFVPKPGGQAEDDGWIIVGVLNAEEQRGEIAILDAANISAGPVAKIKLPHMLPTGLHGCWAADYLGPDPSDVGVPDWCEPQRVRQL